MFDLCYTGLKSGANGYPKKVPKKLINDWAYWEIGDET